MKEKHETFLDKIRVALGKTDITRIVNNYRRPEISLTETIKVWKANFENMH